MVRLCTLKVNEMTLTPEEVHSALKQIPTDSPYVQPLSLALSLLSKGEPIRETLADKIKMCIKLIELEGVGNAKN